MADDQSPKDLLPKLLDQNPSLVNRKSQDRTLKKQAQVNNIMDVFLQLLPSNYVSQVTGPFYTLQFQAAAEQLAEIQITAQESYADSAYDYLRPEFRFQILGMLVFPDANDDGYPDLKGDLTYRQFLRDMVRLLLQGATKATVEEGLTLLSDATFEVLERSVLARQTPHSAWDFDDQFTFEINVSETDEESGLERFPVDPFILQENVRIVLRALKPAHTLYDYRHLFTETFGQFFTDAMNFDWENYYYEDFRALCCGARALVGGSGETLTDRTLFQDVTRDFSNVQAGSDLTITSGPNSIHVGGLEGTVASNDMKHIGRYRVEDVLYFPVGDDATLRQFTTTPSGLVGEGTVSNGAVHSNVNFGSAVEGEVLRFSEGPNAGSYLLSRVLGSTGGLVGQTGLSGTSVRVAPSILRLDRRMKQSATGQEYEVIVDRLGKQDPKLVSGEDVSQFFLL